MKKNTFKVLSLLAAFAVFVFGGNVFADSGFGSTEGEIQGVKPQFKDPATKDVKHQVKQAATKATKVASTNANTVLANHASGQSAKK